MIIRNRYYFVLLIVTLLFSIGENLLSFIFNDRLKAIPHILLAVIVIFLLLFKSQHIKLAIKFWSLISIIGGTLVLLGAIMFWLGGAPDRIDYNSIMISIIHILVGGYFYYFCNDSIYT